MSGKSLKSRGKLMRKMTKDGLVERNAATGEDTRLSNREAELDLRGTAQGREPFPQDGKTPHPPAPQGQSANRKQIYRHGKSESAHETLRKSERNYEQSPTQQYHDTHTEHPGLEKAPRPSTGRVSEQAQGGQAKPQQAKPRQHNQVAEQQTVQPYTPTAPMHGPEPDKAAFEGSPVDPTVTDASAKPETAPLKRLNTESHGRLHFTPDDAIPISISMKGKNKQHIDAKGQSPPMQKNAGEPQKHTARESSAEPAEPTKRKTNTDNAPKAQSAPVKTDAPAVDAAAAPKTGKQGKLQFKPDEAAPDKPKITHNRKLSKAQAQTGRVAGKLEKAQSNLPAKHKLRKVSVMDEKSGTAKGRLKFEKTPISQGEHIKGAKPLRPVKSAGNGLMLNAHRKLYQVEHENVGVKAAHRAEMLAEGGIRTALRFRKTAPYRKVAKLERATQKKSVNLAYQRTLAQNPKLKSNILTRAMQKRKIKKDYAKAARESQKAAKRAEKAGSATARAVRAIAGIIRRHPIAATVVILVSLLLFLIISLFGLGSGLGSSGLGGIAASTYLAADADMYAAHEAYTAMEADLQYQLDNYELLNPGYDEYIFELDEIWHDPYVLMSILGALHEGAWTLDQVQSTLAMLFERQYVLTETTGTETRYRTETAKHTDPATGDEHEINEDVAYDCHIVTVTLENFNLSHLPIYIMGEGGLSRYALFKATLGNRADLFPVPLYPHASYYKEYLRYDVPAEYLYDETFAAIIKEADKYLGMPYVWGGYSPKTSFDCSGYVSWVLNNSGWDIGRLGAQGLYDMSAPVPAADAKPGDLVFFHSTYRAAYTVTHVGIYAGDGMMVHAGDPIGYVSIETAYWQNHLYAFGKIY